jgi:hypothetical protein
MRGFGVVIFCFGPLGLIGLRRLVAPFGAEHSQPLLSDPKPGGAVDFAARVLSHALSFADMVFEFFGAAAHAGKIPTSIRIGKSN